MKQLSFWRNLRLVALLIVFVGGCASNVALSTGVEELTSGPERARPGFDAARSSDPTEADAGARKGTSGVVVHIDPSTGEFRPEPPAKEVTPAPAAKASIPQFSEVSSPTLGGGVMIDLKGQFQTPLVATIDAEGKMTLKHETTMPAGMEGK
jgi:hypothetical protein